MPGKHPRRYGAAFRDADELKQLFRLSGAYANILRVQKIVQETWTDLNPAQVAALRLSCDNSWKVIGKIVPDLKAVEMTGEVTQHLAWDPLPITDLDRTNFLRTWQGSGSSVSCGPDAVARLSIPSTSSSDPAS